MKVRYLVVPAAGRGSRMRSEGGGLPKELLPLGGRRAIDFVLGEARAAEIEHVVVVISPEKPLLRRHLEAATGPGGPFEGLNLRFVVQRRPDGEADAIGLTEPLIEHSPVALLYPDNICLPGPGALRALRQQFEQLGSNVVALTEVTAQDGAAYGNSGRVDLVRIREGLYRIIRFHPKGKGSFSIAHGRLRACGLWICGPGLFPALRRARGALRSGEFTDFSVRQVLSSGEGMLGVRLPGRIFDIGTPQGYRLCRKALADAKLLDQ